MRDPYDPSDEINKFRKWQNDEQEIHKAKIRRAQERLKNYIPQKHRERAIPLDPSVLVLTSDDVRWLEGMRVGV